MSEIRPTDIDFVENLDFSQILTNPILDIAARFWEDERYEAFRVCYRSMRVLDDLVDDRKSSGEPITDLEKRYYSQTIDDFVAFLQSDSVQDGMAGELMEVMRQFAIPIWPWRRLAKAMVYDLSHTSFPSFLGFLRYAEGAAVAPAAVFMHLCGIGRKGGTTVSPRYDIREAARPLALFSYLVHIVRDFQKDTQENLCYFADDLLRKYKLDTVLLSRIAGGEEPNGAFRNLIAEYHRFGEYYRARARKSIDRTKPLLPERYQLSVEIIYGLYFQIFERIKPTQGSFTGEALNPSPTEVQERISQTVAAFWASK